MPLGDRQKGARMIFFALPVPSKFQQLDRDGQPYGSVARKVSSTHAEFTVGNRTVTAMVGHNVPVRMVNASRKEPVEV